MATSGHVKKEKETKPPEDNSYDEWAKRLVARPLPNAQTGTTGNFLANAPTETNILPPHQGFDLDSAIGRFTWHTVTGTDKYVPCIFREGVTYACVRMFEVSVMSELITQIPPDIFQAANLSSQYITTAEAKLLSYINSWHCDGFFGSEPFTTKDLVVTVDEMEEFHRYLTFAYNVLLLGGRNKDEDYSRCGFVNINDSLIPYTVLPHGEKGVPLFYFEGQIAILQEKAQVLKGWELAYLKICCKVQGVRKDLVAGATLSIVRLSDLKSYFPKRTLFVENCWVVGRGKSLLNKPQNGIPSQPHAQVQNQNHQQAQHQNVQRTNGVPVQNNPMTRRPGGGNSSATAPTASALLKRMHAEGTATQNRNQYLTASALAARIQQQNPHLRY